MPTLATYVLDRESIKLDAYRLLSLFYANKEIARRSDPMGDFPDAAAKLEQEYFGREMTRLLLTISIALRTLDDHREQPVPMRVVVRYAAARGLQQDDPCV
jgi:hypothetical protein